MAAVLAPRWVLRALVVGAIGSATALPAQAEPAGSGDLDGLRLPDRPVVAGPATPAPPATEPAPPVGAVTVAPGDSLWRIATAHLPPGATADQIAVVTDQWYRTNRAVIGEDPDLLRPGQRLTAPRPVTAQENPS